MFLKRALLDVLQLCSQDQARANMQKMESIPTEEGFVR